MDGPVVIKRTHVGKDAGAVTIRGVESCDRAGLYAVIDASSNLSAQERDCAKELLDIYLDDAGQEDYLFLVAIGEAGRTLGFVCYGMASLADAVYDLYWIIVDPAHRRAGVATKLLETVQKILKDLGARLLVAETSGSAAYQPARDFYGRNGFREEARIEGFYRPGDDQVIYVKRF